MGAPIKPSLADALGGHDNNYTLIRAILAASVIYYHSFAVTKAPGFTDYITALFDPVTSTGGLAVQGFFFLSGIFVTQSFYRDRRLSSFIAKRFLRIWPGFIICLVVTALLACLVTCFAEFPRYAVFDGVYDYVVRNTFFDLTWEIDGIYTDHRYRAINGPIHTLPLEARMYATLGIVGALRLLGGSWQITVTGAVLTVLAMIPGLVEMLPITLFDAAYSRTAGAMFLAGVTVFGAAQWITPRLWHVPVALLLTVVTQGTAHVLAFYLTVITALLYLGQAPWLGKIARPRDDLSYGIYLYGWPCQQMVGDFFPEINPYLLSLVALALAILFAAASWRFVERPAMRFAQFLAANKLRSWQMPAGGPPGMRSVATVAIVFALCLLARQVIPYLHLVPTQKMAATIVDFGPHSSRAGDPINQQPNGGSAIWLKMDGNAPSGTRVVFDGHRLDTTVDASLVTAGVPSRILKSAGEKRIYLERRGYDRIEQSNAVTMQILKR